MKNLNGGTKLLPILFAAGLLIAGLGNGSGILKAQSAPAFEVASVKPTEPGDRRFGRPRFLPGGRFTATGLPLLIIIATAYNLPFQGTQLAGGPEWIRSFEDRYDIEAKAEADAVKGLSARDRAQKMRLMLQALLAERFKLTLRRDIKEQPVYVLTVARNGPKLQTSKYGEKDCEDTANPCHSGGVGQGRGIHVKAFDMAELAVEVSNYTDHPLIDRTGLTGLYDIDTEGWVPMRPRVAPPGTEATAESIAMADPTRPTLYMIFDKLGLKMQASRAPLEVFVIERVEKPGAN